MAAATKPGALYRCPVCGAEIILLRRAPEGFRPVCCKKPMLLQPRHAPLYRCQVCGTQVAIIGFGDPAFRPKCCNREMKLEAA